MTFEQWTEEMSKGLSPRNDEKSKTPSCTFDRIEGETEEDDLTPNPSHNS
jgi:hypothetical protein